MLFGPWDNLTLQVAAGQLLLHGYTVVLKYFELAMKVNTNHATSK